MRIVEVEAIPLNAKLSAPFKFARIERTTSSNVFLRLTADDGSVAYGEACPVPQLTGETQEGVVALLEQRIAPLLVDGDPRAWRPLIAASRTRLHGAPFTAAAVDMALLDLAGKALGQPVHTLLGGAHRQAVTLHGSVGWDEDAERMADTAEQQAASFGALKLYAGRDTVHADLERVRAVRKRVGAAHPFLIDVNGLWSPMDALTAGPALADLGVVMVEQPVAQDDPAGQREVNSVYAAQHAIDVVADERIRNPTDVHEVAHAGLARCANVGLSKLGGVVAAFDAATVAKSLHLGVMVGSVVELGVATAAGVQLAAALPELAYPSYLMGPLKYAQQVTWPPIAPNGGELRVPDEPGLGIEVDEEMVATLDLRRAAAPS